jgi:hypothetical protein
MPAAVEARVLALRGAHPAWGPARIRWQLEREAVALLPARSSVYRTLVAQGWSSLESSPPTRRSWPALFSRRRRLRPVAAVPRGSVIEEGYLVVKRETEAERRKIELRPCPVANPPQYDIDHAESDFE